MDLALLSAMNVERAARRACILVTDAADGTQRLVKGADIATDSLAYVLDAALRSGKSGTVEVNGKDYFLTVQVPPVRLFVIGAVHASQALAPLARVAGFDMTVIDPRTAFATPERFADVKLLAEWPQDVLPGLKLDRYSGLACFTHDPKIDDPALELALSADCFYVGALGSRKTHARRVERLQAKGFTEEQIARIRAPIGMDIGAVSPAEIAVSVLAEIILSLRKKPLRTETDKRAGAAIGASA
ncbi:MULTISPECIES: XdhC family protein [unclassified Beijerinckia]|uniref:XdhC family protein n=1 Tax=unclassified Beijerinckia TaxID=2638183 RepID=UPI00089574DD|nr:MULTISPECIES: XdhC family protein [unclassified Beijerinckia]MDH7799469.1 xanthine dehydrogenase accessory factor [Beijerinckia sp. GAS462]SED51559.1 predicted sulfurylase large subunit, molybdopterin cytosine dinucleotide biosynthesis [Beijerinckia sp. 28-YEA-48]